MRDENRIFLDNLPSTLTLNIADKNLLFVHGSPNKINEYLLKDGNNTLEVVNSINEDALICAHTHIPGIKEFGNKIYVNSGIVFWYHKIFFDKLIAFIFLARLIIKMEVI